MNAADDVRTASAGAASKRAGRLIGPALSSRLGLGAVFLCAALLAALAIVPGGAVAAPPEAFWTRCAADSEADTQCSLPRGVATAPASAGPGIAGDVFVGDSANRRVVEFSAWGQLVRAWGWDVVASGPGDTGTGFEICVPANGDVCKEGTTGSGAGQFGSPQGVAVDSVGDVYVVDSGALANNRVQKFDPEGHFLRMWGGGVNSGTSGNPDLCTNAGPPTDVCKAGTEGSANGQFGELSIVGNYIAVDTLGTASAADDKVYVGDQERIQRFDVNGAFQSQIALPGVTVRGLAVDPSGNLYTSFCSGSTDDCFAGRQAIANVRKLSTAGVELATIAVANPQALATGPTGELFVVDGVSNPTIRQFSAAGAEVPAFAFKDGFIESTGIATGSACLSSGFDLYVANAKQFAPDVFIRAYGPTPDEAHQALCPPPPHAPEITAQATLSVGVDRATVQASINPKFWTDTTYFMQYATAACIEAGGWEAACVKQKPASPATLGAGTIDASAKTAQFTLSGLLPVTEYLYRFSAESSGGGPVHGRGGTEAKEGDATAFTTPAPPVAPGADSCANRIFRTGPSAFLPDCRAYEMVSPVDKNGGDVNEAGSGLQASPDGNRIAYTALQAFGDQPSAKIVNQYLAGRVDGVGWSTAGINAPLGRQLEKHGDNIPILINNETLAFSADLCNQWLVDYNATPLAPEAPQGYTNLYRKDLCGAGGYEALITTAPAPGAKPVTYVDAGSIQGLAADTGGSVLFTARAGLTPDAVGGKTNTQIYMRSGGALHLVSVLRSGAADPGFIPSAGGDPAGGAGVGGGISLFTEGNLEGAVADDGSRVYWTSSMQENVGTAANQGRLYLRENPAQAQSAEAFGSATGKGDLTLASTTVTGVATESGGFVPGQRIEGQGIAPETTIVAFDEGEAKLTLSAPASESKAGAELEAFSECTEADAACTVAVSGGDEANFWDADPSGSEALFSEGSLENEKTSISAATFYRFDAETQTSTPVAGHFRGLLGASEDLSRVYLVSTEVLTGAQKNGEGDTAQAGEPNVYLEEDGTFTFVATLLGGEDGDVSGREGDGAVYNVATSDPSYRTARVTPDGAEVVFESRAPLTGYDNSDAKSDKPDVEVFLYEAGGALRCVSCNPSGARPEGQELRTAVGHNVSKGDVWGAAWIPAPTGPLYASNVLSKDGKRLFFNSLDDWVPQDTNGAQDVYEWEAPGVGGCSKDSPAFHKANGGCVYLITSGESPVESEFWEASADGRDVFFSTESSLLPQDPGHYDLYDARVQGGFPQPTPPPECEGEACQSAPPPPVDPTLSSASFKGAGNPKKGAKPRCAKGKRQVRKAGKTRCVAKHKRHAHKRNAKQKRNAHKRNADHNRRTAR